MLTFTAWLQSRVGVILRPRPKEFVDLCSGSYKTFQPLPSQGPRQQDWPLSPHPGLTRIVPAHPKSPTSQFCYFGNYRRHSGPGTRGSRRQWWGLELVFIPESFRTAIEPRQGAWAVAYNRFTSLWPFQSFCTNQDIWWAGTGIFGSDHNLGAWEHSDLMCATW